MNDSDSNADSDATTCGSGWAEEDAVQVILESCDNSEDSDVLAYDSVDTEPHCVSPRRVEVDTEATHSISVIGETASVATCFSPLASPETEGLEKDHHSASSLAEPTNTVSTNFTSDDEVHSKQASYTDTSFEVSSMECGFEVGFDDHVFYRPQFPYSPSGKKVPLTLSSPGTSPLIQVPAILNQYLRNYQQEGVQFLFQHFHSRSGAILSDDMGLGKTVQVIAFMTAILNKRGTKADVLLTGPKQVDCKGTFLIICPSSILYNWTSEIETWSHLKYCIFHRGKKEDALERTRRKRVEVVLTTHETARSHVEELNSVDWLAVICDEVQVIKSPLAQVTSALNSLREKRRIGLTGTAIQNNLNELWSILNWANPGCLGSASEFHSEFECPILEGQKYNCTKRQLALGRQRLSELEELTKRWVLRRTKALIASELPKKEEVVVFCPISSLQEQVYQEILDTEDAQLVLHAGDPCDCFSGKDRGSCCHKENRECVGWQKLGYSCTVLLSKCANHLGLLLPSNTSSTSQKEMATKVCEQVFSRHPEFLKLSREASFLTLSDIQYCGKLQVVHNLLSKFKAEKNKVIIFSNSVMLLNMLENYVVSQGYTYSRLDGNTKIENRTNIVNAFNTDPSQFLFLISKKCGGVGLNVTGANRVIIFDPSWNPASDLQAEDRAFRIGQSRDVIVYRLITEGTVEEMVYLRQVYKQQLANMTLEGSKERRYFTSVAGDPKQKGELFGYSNLWPLRKADQPGLNLTMDLLKRVDCMEAGVKAFSDQIHNSPATVTARQFRDMDSVNMPDGTTAIAHSGGKSVVESSSVEEHIGREALADVYQLQRHSQDPANYVSNKLDLKEVVSDESDDIECTPQEKNPSPASQLQQLQPSAPVAPSKVPVKKVTRAKGTRNRERQKVCRNKSKLSSSVSRQKRVGKKGVKGLQYEDPLPLSVKECEPGRDQRLLSSDDESVSGAEMFSRRKGRQSNIRTKIPSLEMVEVKELEVKELEVQDEVAVKSQSPFHTLNSDIDSARTDSVEGQGTLTQGSLSDYSCANHQMVDELFEEVADSPKSVSVAETKSRNDTYHDGDMTDVHATENKSSDFKKLPSHDSSPQVDRGKVFDINELFGF